MSCTLVSNRSILASAEYNVLLTKGEDQYSEVVLAVFIFGLDMMMDRNVA